MRMPGKMFRPTEGSAADYLDGLQEEKALAA